MIFLRCSGPLDSYVADNQFLIEGPSLLLKEWLLTKRAWRGNIVVLLLPLFLAFVATATPTPAGTGRDMRFGSLATAAIFLCFRALWRVRIELNTGPGAFLLKSGAVSSRIVLVKLSMTGLPGVVVLIPLMVVLLDHSPLLASLSEMASIIAALLSSIVAASLIGLLIEDVRLAFWVLITAMSASTLLAPTLLGPSPVVTRTLAALPLFGVQAQATLIAAGHSAAGWTALVQLAAAGILTWQLIRIWRPRLLRSLS